MKFSKRALVGALCIAGILGSGIAAAADTATVTVSGTVVGTCKFIINTGALSFTMDPSVGGAVPGTPTNPTFWCTKGTSVTLTPDQGLNWSGTSRQMEDSVSGDFIAYTMGAVMTGTPGGPSTTLTATLSGSVAAIDYLTKSAGSYSDTVILSVSP